MTKHQPAAARPTRGFTLIESMAALAVAATLVTMALPNLGMLVERRRVEGAAAQLVADLHFLRTQSVARNRALRISFGRQPDGGSCYVLHAEARAASDCATAADPIKAVRLAAGGVQLDANVAAIVYDPTYGTSTPAATLRVVAAGGTALHGVVNMMGRVRVCAPNADFVGYRTC